MRITQMAQAMYANQQLQNKLTANKTGEMKKADVDAMRIAAKADKSAEEKEKPQAQDQLTISDKAENTEQAVSRKYGLYTRDGQFISQEDTLRRATEMITNALKNDSVQRAEMLANNEAIGEEMERQEKLFESMSEPVFHIDGYAASASSLMNDRITVTITVESDGSSKPDRPDRPPHHHDHHRSSGVHERYRDDHHHGRPEHRPPHDGECGNTEERITLTFVKSLALQSGPESENPLKVNGQSILTNEKGEAMVIMPDDTVRYVKLDQALLDQIAQTNQKEDNTGTGALRIL